MLRKKYLFYLLAIISAFAVSAETAVDAIISHDYIKDPWILGLSFFLVATFITLIIAVILSIRLKKKSLGSLIDPSFSHFRILRKQEVLFHLLAGAGNAVLTLGYFYVVSRVLDPSIILSFSQLSILYLLVVESISEKNTPTMADIQSSIIVTFGAILGSIGLSGDIDIESLLVVFLVMNPGLVLFAEFQRKLKRLRIDDKLNDSINIRFWNLFFTTVTITIIMVIFDYTLIEKSITAISDTFIWLFAGALITFISVVLFIRAMGIGRASITQAIRSSSIIFAIPFFILLTKIIPELEFESNPSLYLIKSIGIILVITGVISFALTEVKMFIFIRTMTGHSSAEIQQKIWQIKGVTSVSVTAGSYDIIVKTRMRTLGKNFESIIRKLEDISGIKEFKMVSVLKEWEEL